MVKGGSFFQKVSISVKKRKEKESTLVQLFWSTLSGTQATNRSQRGNKKQHLYIVVKCIVVLDDCFKNIHFCFSETATEREARERRQTDGSSDSHWFSQIARITNMMH